VHTVSYYVLLNVLNSEFVLGLFSIVGVRKICMTAVGAVLKISIS